MSKSEDRGKLDIVYERVIDEDNNINKLKVFIELMRLVHYRHLGECFEYFLMLKLFFVLCLFSAARLEVNDITARHRSEERELLINSCTIIPGTVDQVPNLFMLAVYVIYLVRNDPHSVNGTAIIPPGKTAAFDLVILGFIFSEDRHWPTELSITGAQATVNQDGHKLHPSYGLFYSLIAAGLETGAKAGLHPPIKIDPAYLLITPPGTEIKGRHKYPHGHRHLHAQANPSIDGDDCITHAGGAPADARFSVPSAEEQQQTVTHAESKKRNAGKKRTDGIYQRALKYVRDPKFGTDDFQDFANTFMDDDEDNMDDDEDNKDDDDLTEYDD